MAKWSKLLPLLLFVFILSFCIAHTAAGAEAVLLMSGSHGSLVRVAQTYLHQLNYLKQEPTGNYGRMTVEAVKSFQLEHGLVASGVTDTETFDAIQQAYSQKNSFTEYTVAAGETLPGIAAKLNTSIAAIMVKNNLSSNEVIPGQKLIIPMVGNGARTVNSRSRMGMVQEIPWSIVNQLWKNLEVARMIDVDTGKSLMIRRYYGYYHADVEPLTKRDTQTLKEIYGGHWSWSRRAVIIQVHNLYIAASINGMPHGGRSIYDNNFPGQFCAHFLGSRVHKSGTVDADHLAMIDKAAISAAILMSAGLNPEDNGAAAGVEPGSNEADIPKDKTKTLE